MIEEIDKFLINYQHTTWEKDVEIINSSPLLSLYYNKVNYSMAKLYNELTKLKNDEQLRTNTPTFGI